MSAVIEIVRGLVEAKGKEVPTMGFVYGPLGVLSQIRGHAELFKDIIRHPDRVLEAVHTINDVLVEYALAQVQAGAHAIVLDPLYSSASILKKSTWVKFEAEIFKSVADAVRDAGVPVIVHNCGGGVYFDAVIEYINPIAISHAYPAHGSADWEEHAANWAKKVVTIGVADPAKTGHEFTQAQVLEGFPPTNRHLQDCGRRLHPVERVRVSAQWQPAERAHDGTGGETLWPVLTPI